MRADQAPSRGAHAGHRRPSHPGRPERDISPDWSDEDVSLYLDRCQIDTPDKLVEATWAQVRDRRAALGKVVDFGAGDGRFARHGTFGSYVGYEIDLVRCGHNDLPANASFVHRCAFADVIRDADLCIGNPPFVRNQDLPAGWRSKVADDLRARSGLALSGLANAWQYFFLLSLLSAADDGLCALVIPYEWVSRPSTRALRDYIAANRWAVDVYRLDDAAFKSVLTTSSITIVDKAAKSGRWSFFAQTEAGIFERLPAASRSADGYLPYTKPSRTSGQPRAVRGLSPGTQKVFVLTDAERSRFGLKAGRDVLPCVTSLRLVPQDLRVLDEQAFDRHFRVAGKRCWLIRADRPPGRHLASYLDSIPPEAHGTETCLARDVWWKFKMPVVPDLLVATTFKGSHPKMVSNRIAAHAVGGVAGIHGLAEQAKDRFRDGMASWDVKDRIIAHANGLKKIEINQLNGLLAEILGPMPS